MARADLCPLRRFDYLSGRKGATYNRKNFDIQSFPEDLDRKVYLMTYFEDYMTKTLERDVEWVFSDASRSRNMDFLVKYYRMKNAIVFKLSNDVLQVRLYPLCHRHTAADDDFSSISLTTPRSY